MSNRSLGWLTRIESAVLQSFYANLKGLPFASTDIIASVTSGWTGESRRQQVMRNSLVLEEVIPEGYYPVVDALYKDYIEKQRFKGREVTRHIPSLTYMLKDCFIRFGTFAITTLGIGKFLKLSV